MMRVHVGNEATVDGFQSALNTLSNDQNVRAVMALVCDDNGWDPQQIDPVLQKTRCPLFGGIFPALINGTRKMDQGFILVGLPFEVQLTVIPELSQPDQDFDATIDALLPDTGDCKTMFVLVDGFAKRISAFIDSLFNTFGLEMNYIGGGAGSLSMIPKPCLITNQGLLPDSALLVGFDMVSSIGVSHGWRSISGPHKVTESNQNRIISIEWQPAFDFYREVVEDHSSRTFNDGNFLELVGAYPFGIAKMGTERVVRDPIMTDDQGGLTCVGEIPEGAFVDILNGDNASLIEAAGTALSQAQQRFPANMPAGVTIFIDCISRVLFLKDNFGKELEAVQTPELPMFGVCSLGEIANSGNDYLEFYNKTSVVGIMGGL